MRTATVTPVDDLDVDGRRALGNVLRRLTGRHSRVMIGRYLVEGRLGAGACGAVYAAHDPSLDRRVAIKVVLPPSRAADDEVGAERLVREAHALAKLRHPNVVEVFDVGVDDHDRRASVYVVMELVEGATIRQWLERDRPSAAQIVEVFRRAARGLAAAHAVGVVHRDFKPANAMIADDGQVKVLDFGLARDSMTVESITEAPAVDDTDTGSSRSGSLTRTGTVMGTPRYMAPEQHTAEAATALSDQYALCVSLWEALMAEPPFAGRTMTELAAQKYEGPPPRPAAMSRALYRVLARGLAIDPRDRFETLDALADALQAPRRHRRIPVLMGAMAAGLAFMGGLALLPSSPPVCAREGGTPAWSARIPGVVERATPPRSSNAWGIQDRLRLRFERFATQWDEARATVCHSDEPLTASPAEHGACLDRAALRFEEILDDFEADDPELSPVNAMLALAVPAQCLQEDPQAMFTGRLSPRMQELVTLAERAIVKPGQGDPEAIAAAIAEAREANEPWVTGMLLTAQAQADMAAGRSGDAGRRLEESAWLAENAGDSLLALEQMPAAIGNTMDSEVPPEDLARMFEHADALLEATGQPASVAVQIAALRALQQGRLEDTDGATQWAQRAKELAGDVPPPGSERMLAMAIVTAASYEAERDPKQAIADIEGALTLVNDQGTWYPAVAAYAYDCLASAALELNDPSLAAQHIVTKLRWMGKIIADDNPISRYAAAGYGRILAVQGATDEGIGQMRAAYFDIFDQAPGLTTKLAYIADDLAETHLRAGRYEDARHWAQRSLQHDTEQHGDEVPHLAWAHLSLARAHVRVGDLDEASSHVAAAFERYDRSDDDADVFAHLVRAELRLAQGRFEPAAADARAGLARLQSSHGSHRDVGNRAELYFALAAAMRGLGDAKADETEALGEQALSRAAAWYRHTPRITTP